MNFLNLSVILNNNIKHKKLKIDSAIIGPDLSFVGTLVSKLSIAAIIKFIVSLLRFSTASSILLLAFFATSSVLCLVSSITPPTLSDASSGLKSILS